MPTSRAASPTCDSMVGRCPTRKSWRSSHGPDRLGGRRMGTLALPVRAYRLYPPRGRDYDDHQYGHVYDEVELTTADTAVIAIDLWNLGADGPPLVPKLGKYWEYNYLGGHGVARSAETIVAE